MAPDADKVRLERRNMSSMNKTNENDEDNEEEETELRVFETANDLSGNLIAIDGIVYTLEGFNHPGGEQIKLFGGNDVTVQYKMIHPHHYNNHINSTTGSNAGTGTSTTGSTGKQLKKLTVVGRLAKSDHDYQFDTPFERDLKLQVFKIVKRGQEFATYGYMARAFLYILLYVTCLYHWITSNSTFTKAAIFGIAHALIGLNVQHDANHGAVSRKPFWNDLLGFGVDMIGGSKWLWMEQHWTHHA